MTAPSLELTVTAGETVNTIYTVNRSGAAVSAFYDLDGKPDSGDEVIFASGLPTGQNKILQFNTGGLTAGTICLGIISQDSSGKIYAYAPGTITIRDLLNVTVASPMADLSISPGGKCTVRFTASAVTTFSYRVFYDQDGLFNGDEVTIASGTGSGTNFVSATWDTTGLPAGAYFIGVRVAEAAPSSRAGLVYASGRVLLSINSYLSVVSPAVDLALPAGSPIDVTFTAVVPGNTSAVVDIYYDVDQTFSGNEPTIQTDLSYKASFLQWDTHNVQPGTYYVCAVVRSAPGGSVLSVAYSTGKIRLEASQ